MDTINSFFIKIFGKSFKTSLFGIISAILTSVVDVLKTGTVSEQTLILSISIAVLGLLAKDFDATHGGIK